MEPSSREVLEVSFCLAFTRCRGEDWRPLDGEGGGWVAGDARDVPNGDLRALVGVPFGVVLFGAGDVRLTRAGDAARSDCSVATSSPSMICSSRVEACRLCRSRCSTLACNIDDPDAGDASARFGCGNGLL